MYSQSRFLLLASRRRCSKRSSWTLQCHWLWLCNCPWDYFLLLECFPCFAIASPPFAFIKVSDAFTREARVGIWESRWMDAIWCLVDYEANFGNARILCYPPESPINADDDCIDLFVLVEPILHLLPRSPCLRHLLRDNLFGNALGCGFPPFDV